MELVIRPRQVLGDRESEENNGRGWVDLFFDESKILRNLVKELIFEKFSFEKALTKGCFKICEPF